MSINQSVSQSVGQPVSWSVRQSRVGFRDAGSADLDQVARVPVQLSKDDALRCCQRDAHLQPHQQLITIQ